MEIKDRLEIQLDICLYMMLLLTKSLVIPSRTKCRHCFGKPEFFYYVNVSSRKIKPNSEIKKIKHDSYHSMNPGDLKDFKISSLLSTFAGAGLAANPRAFRKNKNSSFNKFAIVLTCECCKTLWSIPSEIKINQSSYNTDYNIKNLFDFLK